MYDILNYFLLGAGLIFVCVPIVKWAINIIKEELPKFHMPGETNLSV